MRGLLSMLALLATAYALVAAALFLLQPQLVFLPQIGRESAPTPAQLGLDFEDLRLATADGETLHAWWVAAPGADATVLFLHGNAGSIAGRVDWLPMFRRLRANVLLLEYRGYGRSTGTPSEDGLYADARAGWDHLTRGRGIEAARIVLFGESLGAAPAAWLAARTRPGALVLHSAFSSLPDLAAELYWWLPARRLTRYRFDTLEQVRAAAAPLLVAHSPQDEVVPFAHGRRIFEAAAQPKRFLELAGGHNEGFIFADPRWVEELDGFLRAHLPPRRAAPEPR